jgi:hypothetical protein
MPHLLKILLSPHSAMGWDQAFNIQALGSFQIQTIKLTITWISASFFRAFCYLCALPLTVLGMESKASSMLGKHYTTENSPSPDSLT